MSQESYLFASVIYVMAATQLVVAVWRIAWLLADIKELLKKQGQSNAK
jgi:hypothetical protein